MTAHPYLDMDGLDREQGGHFIDLDSDDWEQNNELIDLDSLDWEHDDELSTRTVEMDAVDGSTAA